METSGNLIQGLIRVGRAVRSRMRAVEDGWGQVRGCHTVFFMLQIRSRCRWDYTTGVITHLADPHPLARDSTCTDTLVRFQNCSSATEWGASVTDAMLSTTSKLAGSRPSMKIYGAWKSDSWTTSPEQILQVNVSFKRINQAASKRRVHADTRFLRDYRNAFIVEQLPEWRTTRKCLAIEYWLIAACKLIFV